MTQRMWLTVAVGVVLVAGAVIILVNGATPKETTAQDTNTPTETTANTYTMAQVAEHGDATSCWSAINGNVYDLTAWVGSHPGGERAILSLCGEDGSASFNGQHGSYQQALDALATMKIGTLAE